MTRKLKQIPFHCINNTRKRSLEVNPTKYFESKSSMQSWENQNSNQFWREQENSIAYNVRKLPFTNSKLENSIIRKNEKISGKNEIVRRDDSDIGKVIEKQVNSITCANLVKFSRMIRLKESFDICISYIKNRNGVLKPNYKTVIANKFDGNFKDKIIKYVLSVREIGNYCLFCNNAIKIKSLWLENNKIASVNQMFCLMLDFRILAIELFYWYSIGKRKYESELVRTTKVNRFKYKENGKTFVKKIHRIEDSKITYKKSGYQMFYADILDCNLITLKNGKIASLNDIMQGKIIKFSHFESTRIIGNSVCNCPIDEICK